MCHSLWEPLHPLYCNLCRLPSSDMPLLVQYVEYTKILPRHVNIVYLFIYLFIYLFAQIQLHRWSKHVIVINVQCTHSNLKPFQMVKLSWFFILHVHGSRPSGMILNMSKWCVLTKTEILTTKCMQNSVTEEKGSLLLMLS